MIQSLSIQKIFCQRVLGVLSFSTTVATPVATPVVSYTAKMQTFSVQRYNPAADIPKPYMQTFSIDRTACGPMLLDVLFKIKDEQDSSLTFRRSCREGICGSCAMNMEGTNGLACLTPIPKPTDSPVEIRALPNLYLIRDLVVDMSNFYNQYKSVEPWLKRKTEKKSDDREILQSKEDRKKLDGLYEAYRWIADSRDEHTTERLVELNDTMKLFRCHAIGNCTVVCPKGEGELRMSCSSSSGLDPARAIVNIKEMIEDNYSEDWDSIKADQVKKRAELAQERETRKQNIQQQSKSTIAQG